MGKVLITCNPKKNWLYYNYYLPHRDGNLPVEKAFIQATVEDNPKGESGYKKKLAGLKGITKQRLFHGLWEYDSDISALIETDAISRLFRPMPGQPKSAPKQRRRITVDVARFGEDSSVIGLWEGFHVKLWRFNKLSTTQLAAKVKKFADLYGEKQTGPDGKEIIVPIPNHRIIVDADGVGGGVVDQLNARQFINGSSALPSPVNPAYDEVTGDLIPEQYRNLKSQCWFRTAEKINAGIITVEVMPTDIETTEEEERIRITEDCEQVKAKNIDSDGKMEVIGKKIIRQTIGRSTDYFDTIAMHELFILEPEFEPWAY
jgi:hypothetical protein